MKLYMFRTVFLPIIRSSFTVQDLVLLDSSVQIRMTYTIAACTVNKLLVIGRRTVRNM